MSNDTLLTDEYVADILAKEASDASVRYSAMGLEALRSSKPANKAKPNTRFLGRIIKETTNHNAALLAREAAEAQARLDGLTEAEDKKRRKLKPSAVDTRQRQLGDISSYLLGGKRKHGQDPGKLAPEQAVAGINKDKTPCNPAGDHERKESRRHRDIDRHDRDRDRDRDRDGHRDGAARESAKQRTRSQSPIRQQRKGHRNRSPLSNGKGDEEYEEHTRRTGGEDGRRILGRARRDLFADLVPSSGTSRRGRLAEEEDGNDFDPLEDLIGPAPPPQSPPPVRTRGRGAARGAAAMDSRFSEDYDPLSDVHPDLPEANDDWGESVELYRDRQKWKQQGAARLRDAGFTEDQIKKWEKGGDKDIDDVRWSKPGEGREWDRGKEKGED
ncbi:hypothetical protein B0T26DRAFT_744176 [Lasiosphaeria miniovina]|uniref:Pre-mRNA-splicing factor 38B n=1 Tax=Lasiosphaeria miniovina TaxID=1954250 RepID=A0AA40DKD9_9PEZI|nr:uncharacterized protein B0T26DRAFT_744176 [Lasiosphaeria miniovina]KAK0703053.1 hypothetical protein B0T26DRAFT_744176 [Lasiosphaeria miniovina]